MAEAQRIFVRGYLKEFYKKCKKAGITVLGFFGNDDLYCFKNDFKKYGELLDEHPAVIGEYEFKAYGYVPDYKFGLKTACKLDHPYWELDEPYISRPVDVDPNGILHPIDNIEKYFEDKGSIRVDLKKIKGTSKTVMAFHCPPCNMDLDVCGIRLGDLWLPRKQVGSQAIYDWIKKEQPALVLCGHIHESYAVTKRWKAVLGKTQIIQPGQLKETTTMVAVELGDKVVCEIISS